MKIQTEAKIKVFIPVENRRFNKSNLSRGYWQSEAGKIERDLINVKEYNQSITGIYYQGNFYNYLDLLKQIKTNGKPQDCIFYKIGNVGYIYYSRDKIKILPKRIYQEISRGNLRKAIRQGLSLYNGITIYRETGKYYLECFTTF